MKTQTDSNKYEGQCKFCQNDYTKRQILEHLNTCLKRKENKNIENLRLRIIDSYMKNFWLIVEVNTQAKFKDLDKLIREVWVECCGHLSLFGDYGNEISKGEIIMNTVKTGGKINYIYDFGSSTELTIEILKTSNYQLNNKKKVELVARNYLPISNCLKCNKQATTTCAACNNNGGMVFICDECAPKYHNEENERGTLSLTIS